MFYIFKTTKIKGAYFNQIYTFVHSFRKYILETNKWDKYT